MSRRSVGKWCSDFKSGQVGTKDNERICRLTATDTHENETHIESANLDKRRVTASEP